jgi:hypothetical protein
MADHRSVVAGDRLSWVFAGTLLVAAVTGAVALLAPHLPGALGLPALYLLAILPIAYRWGPAAGMVVAAASTVIFGLVIVSPGLGFVVDGGYAVSLGVFLLTACVAAYMASRPPWEAGRLLDEQAAVRRISRQVAQGASVEAVFASVADEATRLLQADVTLLARVHDGTGTFVAVGGWAGGPVDVDFAVGQRWGTSAIRIDDVPIAAAGIPLRSSVWSPVTVAGRHWGGIVVGLLNGLLPADTEQRLGSFAELAGPAIASAQSRVELAALVERHPALGAEVDRDGGPERSIGPGLAQ